MYFGRLEHAVADLVGRLDARVDRIDDANEDAAITDLLGGERRRTRCGSASPASST